MLTYTIDQFLNSLKANNRSKSSIKNARIALEQLNEFKPLEDVDAHDLDDFIVHIRDKYGYKESTIGVRKSYIKKFFIMNDLDMVVKRVKIPKSVTNLNPKDILIAEDIDLIIENVNNPKYKALIAVLWETGGRIGEVINIEKDTDLIETDLGYRLYLFGDKTRAHNYAYREILLSQSAPYVRDWLLHNDSDSPYLFPVSSTSVRMKFTKLHKKLNEKYGFKKNIHPHAFRHACATRLVREKVQESYIRKQMGWTSDSNMLSVYIHLASNDVYDYHARKITGKDKEFVHTHIKQPEETAFGRIKKLEAMVNALMKDKLEREPLLEAQVELHPEEFEREDIRPDVMPQSSKSVGEIEEMQRNPDTSIIEKDADREYFKEHFNGKPKAG